MRRITQRALWVALAALLLAGIAHAQTDLTCEDIQPPTDDLSYYVGLGNGYYAQGSYNTAIAVYTCALDVNPDFAPAYVSRGFAYAVQGNQAAALDDYNRAIELDDSLLAAYNNRGMLYTQQGRFGLAFNDFDLIVALDPQNAVAYHNRGVVHAAEGDYDLAMADFQQAIALDPTYPAPHAALGVIYSALAVQSYARYSELAGAGARLPSGDADIVIESLAIERETGTFNTWLPLLAPAR